MSNIYCIYILARGSNGTLYWKREWKMNLIQATNLEWIDLYNRLLSV